MGFFVMVPNGTTPEVFEALKKVFFGVDVDPKGLHKALASRRSF